MLWTSRVDTTRLLAEAVAESRTRVFITASAIGYYGPSDDRRFASDDGPGEDFLARLCVDWEAARQPAIDADVRTATVRIGVVQGLGGGALRKMLLPFKLGLGGPVGHGRQWVSWIHMQDIVSMLVWLLEKIRVTATAGASAHPSLVWTGTDYGLAWDDSGGDTSQVLFSRKRFDCL